MANELIYIGSQAAYIRGLLANTRTYKSDWDFICTYETAERYCYNPLNSSQPRYFVPTGKGKKISAALGSLEVEFEIAWPGSTAEEFMQIVMNDPACKRFEGNSWLPSVDALYALKMSHRYLRNSPNFIKTMRDIKVFRAAGATIQPQYLEWYKRRQKETYNYKHPSLMQSKDGFFSGDQVQYMYDHDSIHKVIAEFHGKEVPAYTLFQKDGEEVAVDRAKWNELPHEEKLRSVLEETYVLALERSQIPYPKTQRSLSFHIALEKVCTSITSGWWREFAWEHYEEVHNLYNPLYTEHFWRAVASGQVPQVNSNV
jgi:hypothetical protein